MQVFLTRCNVDTTEGRGPMVNDKCFTSHALAAQYVDGKPGIMGRTRKWSVEPGDWEIIAIEVLSAVPEDEASIKKRALAKLSAIERRVLGLS